MKRYLVGGAVRDQLLGQKAKDFDWLVVETSPAELIDLGYRKVGKSFPVYLHPDTAEEHSFPRGPIHFKDNLASIHADLERRDLTINAIAIGTEGEIIDPLGGKKDLEQRILRHTPAFTDDPLRIIRTARLLADLAPHGFSVAPETLRLMQTETANGALQKIPKERIWSEIERALSGENPTLFFVTLKTTHALDALLPELLQLFGIPQPAKYHPEIDCGKHALLALTAACALTDDASIRFAALIHDLGKGTTPASEWPSHRGHEHRGLPLIRALCQRLGSPKCFTELSLQVCEYHTQCHNAFSLKSGTLLRLFQKLDSFRKADRFNHFLLTCEADSKGRLGHEDVLYPQRDYLRSLANAARNVDFSPLNLSEKSIEERIELINRARLKAIQMEKQRLHSRMV